MAIRNVTAWDDPLFRKASRGVERFDSRLWALLDDMLDTLRRVGGYGCAAVHIGTLRRVVVVDAETGVMELVNPILSQASAGTQEVAEGSIAPGAPRATVTRPKDVVVQAFDRNGNPVTVQASGFLAATLCHELDHLDGILFTDKAKAVQ